MRFVTTAQVRNMIQADSIDRLNIAIEAAGDFVTERMKADLNTDFSYSAAVTDIFFVKNMNRHGALYASRWKQRFALSRGFLAAAPTVTYATSRASLTSSPTTLTSDYWACDLTRGELSIFDIDLRDVYIKVAYAAGFNADSGDALLYDQSETPDWLQQAAKNLTLVHLLRTNPDLKNDDDFTGTELEDVAKAAQAVLAQHHRNFVMAVRPE